jgi:hypothetical protein
MSSKIARSRSLKALQLVRPSICRNVFAVLAEMCSRLHPCSVSAFVHGDKPLRRFNFPKRCSVRSRLQLLRHTTSLRSALGGILKSLQAGATAREAERWAKWTENFKIPTLDLAASAAIVAYQKSSTKRRRWAPSSLHPLIHSRSLDNDITRLEVQSRP